MKNKQEAYEKLIEMSRNDNYITGNLLDYPYNQKYYKLIVIDLSRQKKTSTSQQMNFLEKLEEDNETKMFFIAEKQQKTKNYSHFFLDLLNVTETM